MSTPIPNHDDHSDLCEAMRRDAIRMQEPPLDAALHHATIGRIRSISGARSGLRLMPTLAAGVALLVIVVIFTRREPLRVRPDVTAAIASTQKAIAGLTIEPPSSLPAWMSPTASLLDQPGFPQ